MLFSQETMSRLARAANVIAAFMLMTVIPILPGGLGAMEAAMTAAFAGMGIETAAALTASIIFRLFYYIFPGFMSIFVYWGLKISEKKRGIALAAKN